LGSWLSNFLDTASQFFGTGIQGGDRMKLCPRVEELLALVLRVAMPRAVVSLAYLRRYITSRGRGGTVPVPPRIHVVGSRRTFGTF